MAEKFECPVCGRKDFKAQRGLTQHMTHAHPDYQQGAVQLYDDKPAASRGSKALIKSGSLDAAVDKLQVPAVPQEYNGATQIFWDGFNRGVSYGVNTIMAGIRSAQELSSLGIAQATPIIKMAQEMRQAEGQAAQEAAGQLAQITVQGNQQVLDAIRAMKTDHVQQAATQPVESNPMARAMTDAMQPYMSQIIGQVFSGVFKAMPQQQGAQQPAAVPQQQAEGWSPPNVVERSLDEYEGEIDG